MHIVLVQPEALRGHWDRIRESLEAVRAKAPGEDWICEDVYHAIKAGKAACHIGIGDAGYLGCLITELTNAPYSREPVFHVWIVHSVGDDDVFAAGLGLVQAMAKAAGATKITMGSPRMGWQKRFTLASAVYELPMGDAE